MRTNDRPKGIDLISINQQNIIGITARSSRGRRWLEPFLAEPGDTSVRYEAGFAVDVIRAAIAAGLRVRDRESRRVSR